VFSKNIREEHSRTRKEKTCRENTRKEDTQGEYADKIRKEISRHHRSLEHIEPIAYRIRVVQRANILLIVYEKK